MSQILRLSKKLHLLRDAVANGYRCRFGLEDGLFSNGFNNLSQFHSTPSRLHSFSSKLLSSHGSTKVKVFESHARRKRWRKRKSASKQKVETELFKLLNARTTQLALEALSKDTNGEIARYIPDAVIIVPENTDVVKIKDKVKLAQQAICGSIPADPDKNRDKVQPMQNTTSETVHSPNATRPFPSPWLQDLKFNQPHTSELRESARKETWESSLDTFKNQFSVSGVSNHKQITSLCSESEVSDWNQSNANISEQSLTNDLPISSLSKSGDHESSVRSEDLSEKRASVSVNANILKHKQILKRFKDEHIVRKSTTPETIVDADGVSKVPSVKRTTQVKTKQIHTKLVKGKLENEKTKLKTNQSFDDSEKWNRMFNQDLAAYVEACCFSGHLSMAQSTIKFYHRNKWKTKHIQDVAIYNTLMHAWAKKGQLERIRELFGFLREDNLQPTLQSYASSLECLGRQKEFDEAMCERVLQDIQKEGFHLQDIFRECTFKKDEKNIVEKAILQVWPDFTAVPPSDPPPYTGPLLEQLNDEDTQDNVMERNPYSGLVTKEELVRRMETQLQREVKGSVTVSSIAAKKLSNKKMKEYREKLSSVQQNWRTTFLNGIEKKIRFLEKKNDGEHGLTLLPYLKLFSPQEYVDCMMLEMERVARASETFSPNMNLLWRQLGARIYTRYNTQEKIRSLATHKTSKIYSEYAGRYCDETAYPSHREHWHELMNRQTDGPSLDVGDKNWPKYVFKGIGKMLYDIILYDLKIDANILKNTDERKMIPAFYTVFRTYGHKTHEEIKPNPILVRLYQGSDLDELTFDTVDLPMLCPPVPWLSQNLGGPLLSSAQLIRLPDAAQTWPERLGKLPPSDIFPVLDSLNVLGACAWIINKPMLDLVIGIFNNKGMKELDIPPPVSSCPPLPKITQTMSSQEKSKVHQERLRLRQEKSEMYSLWCSELYRLSIANKFRDEVFWFPHNMDFRGRTYPCPPHFNHLGSDVARSILKFAKGKPLGPRGLDWLKIHLINLTGFKKRTSNVERLQYANETMTEILDSADNPLEGSRWWQGSDEPWQTLACCKEIAAAVRSPDPSQYVSHFPVHQDGSCNGLQHYAALGRDQAGAESVNLHPFPVPQDVYSDVAELVEKVRRQEAEEGDEIAQLLEGFVRRKVIKQTVMTTVYGVTRYGARFQILRQLKDIPDFPDQHVWTASSYLTQKTFQCLREMFTATRQIQDWLTLCAHHISTVSGKPVEWRTPLGLQVIQPYHKPLSLNRFGVNIKDHWNSFEKPNTMKQKNGFPPNFIHSLDSTHMMLTSLYCLRAGITYVSVHDCFWTHPSSVEVMNKVCREQFVSLHRQPILEDLSRFMLDRFTSDLSVQSDDKAQDILRAALTQVPSRGSFDLENVLESTYFFS